MDKVLYIEVWKEKISEMKNYNWDVLKNQLDNEPKSKSKIELKYLKKNRVKI